ncbi:MAG: HAD family hydrolase [Lachnospiraceae bacterium]|nr:HAD family hydrolase [Lachnospiraceae bacterium]
MESTKYKNYIFDLYATLIDIHTDQNPIGFWRRIAPIMEAYGAVYEPTELKRRYRELIRTNEDRLSDELETDYPEVELGDVFEELLLSAPKLHSHGIWGDPHLWSAETLEKWRSSFAYAFRVISRIKFSLYPDTLQMLEGLKREGKRIYLLSNAQSLFTRPEMQELDLTPYFEDILISSEFRMRKPEIRFMEELISKQGLDIRESVMIGNDMESDVMMAARCGVNAILVNHDGYSKPAIKEGFEQAREAAPTLRREEIEFLACDNLLSIIDV